MMAAETVKGEMNIKAKITKEPLPGILSIPHGWANANANQFTELGPRGPVTGYSEMKSPLCRISTAANASKAA
jgi:hypothetical protein